MLIQLADFPPKLVEKIIDLLPLKDIGNLTELNDYAFQKYHSDILISSSDSHRGRWTQKVKFGHSHDNSQMTKFDRVEYFMEFVQVNERRFIPRSLSFESPFDFLKFGKQFPDVLRGALKTSISFDNYRNKTRLLTECEFPISSLNCGSYNGVALPVMFRTLEDLTISTENMDMPEKFFSMFENLQSLKISDFQGKGLQGLKFLPKTLKALSIDDLHAPSSFKFELKLPNLQRLELDSFGEVTFDLSNLTELVFLKLALLEIHSLEELHLPLNLRSLDCRLLFDLRDVTSVKHLLSLRELTLGPSNNEIEQFEFSPGLKHLSIMYYDIFGETSLDEDECQGRINQNLNKENFRLPSSLLDLSIKGEHMPGFYIPQIELPDSLHSLTIEGLAVREFQSWSFPSSLWEIKFSNCEIQSVDGVVWPYNLTTLDLSGNSFSSIGGLQYLKFLKYLNLSENKITKIRSLPSSLEFLDLSKNHLKRFHGSGITSLRELILDKNAFEGVLSNGILGLPDGLQVLNLSRNKFTQVDKSFKFPSGLRTLSCDVSHFGDQSTFYDTGPRSLWSLNLGVHQYYIPGFVLDTPESYHASLKFELCPNLSQITLTRVPLKSLDLDVYPETLTKLEATYCEIQELKGDFRRLSKLYDLNLRKNSLSKWIEENVLVLPDSVDTLTLCDNGLTKIAGIRTRTSPRFELDIRGNRDLDAESLAILRQDLCSSSNPACTYRIYSDF